MFSVPSCSPVKTEANDWEIWEQLSENLRCSREFSPAREFSQSLPRFTQAMKAQTTCFISFIKSLFSVLTKRKTICEAVTFSKFSQLEDSQTTLLTSFSSFIALWKHTFDQSKPNNYPNYFIISVVTWNVVTYGWSWLCTIVYGFWPNHGVKYGWFVLLKVLQYIKF